MTDRASMDIDVTEREAFLENWEPGLEKNNKHTSSFSYTHSRVPILILAILLATSNYLWWRQYQKQDRLCIRPKLIYSPGKSAIGYERKTLWRNIEGDNVYTGKPRSELDEAWKKLLEPMTIKISLEELDLIGESSLKLADESGYIAELTVFHELHCVKRVRRHLHYDYYYHNLTEEEKTREDLHMDHCLEYWREAAMCRGDVTLATFVWNNGRPFSRVHSEHECVDWTRLRLWAESRAVNMSDMSVLKPDKDAE